MWLDQVTLVSISAVYRVIQNLAPPTPAKTAWTWAKPTIVYHNTTNIKKVCQVWTWGAFRYGLYKIFRKKCVFSGFLVNFANFRGRGTSNFSKFKIFSLYILVWSLSFPEWAHSYLLRKFCWNAKFWQIWSFLVDFANFRGLGTSNFSKFKNIFIAHTSLVNILSGMGSFIFSA